jgi:hypothetical protein
MSSPVQDDFDDREMRLPRWGRGSSSDPSEPVVAAAERLRRQHLRPARPASPEDIEAALSELVRETWSPPALEPVMVQHQPAQRKIASPSLGMVMRVLGAVGCAAGVALFVAGGMPLSSVDTLASVDRQASAPTVAVAPADPVDRHVAAVTPSEQRIIGGSPAFAQTAVIGVAAASTPQRELPQVVTMPTAPPAAAPLEPAAALRALERALDRDEVSNLVKRGQDLVAQGDIAGGRLLLRRAAEAGDPQAMQALGATYDAAVLAKLRVIGVAPDDARARAWYERAAAGGATEASRRLEQLAGRTQ